MAEKTVPEKAHDDAAVKHKAEAHTPAPIADTKPAIHDVAPKRSVSAHSVSAPTTPSPTPNDDPAAFWPKDQPTQHEAPPRDQVWPPTDRQANQGQLAVAETFRTPDGYLVTKHPAAAAMVNRHASIADAQHSGGPSTSRRSFNFGGGPQSLVPAGDIDAQMAAKHEEIRETERALARSREDLDALLGQKNRPEKAG